MGLVADAAENDVADGTAAVCEGRKKSLRRVPQSSADLFGRPPLTSLAPPGRVLDAMDDTEPHEEKRILWIRISLQEEANAAHVLCIYVVRQSFARIAPFLDC